MAKNDALKTASVLAFERKLDPSDGLMFSTTWDDRAHSEHWNPVSIREKSVRGTISNRLKAKQQDAAKIDAAIENPNLQTVDVAALPNTDDTLVVRFTLRVLGGTGTPSACNNAPYEDRLREVVNEYRDEHGFEALAFRYATNLANGRFLWRNRMGAEEVQVDVSRLQKGERSQQWRFDAFNVPMRNFNVGDTEKHQVAELASHIQAALEDREHLLLEISAAVRIGDGQEVFPSQELILNQGNRTKSKTLYSVDGIAGIHSQKLGNAIRTIDTWYPTDNGDDVGPIAVEPYGSVTTKGAAYRQPKQKADFYSLLDNWILKDKKPADAGNQHFVLATLIRGGVFGEGGE